MQGCYFLKCLIRFLKCGFFPLDPTAESICSSPVHRGDASTDHSMDSWVSASRGYSVLNDRTMKELLGQPLAGNPGHPKDLAPGSDLITELLMVAQEPLDRFPCKTAAHAAKLAFRETPS